MFLTFWSCGELEDGGGVCPALLVPRLDYHLQKIQDDNHDYSLIFFDEECKNYLDGSPHNRSRAPIQRM